MGTGVIMRSSLPTIEGIDGIALSSLVLQKRRRSHGYDSLNSRERNRIAFKLEDLVFCTEKDLLTTLFPVSGPTPRRVSKSAAFNRVCDVADWLAGAKALVPAIALNKMASFMVIFLLYRVGV